MYKVKLKSAIISLKLKYTITNCYFLMHRIVLKKPTYNLIIDTIYKSGPLMAQYNIKISVTINSGRVKPK